ncbi:unnamed protein product, partial [Polarella glacialis]
VAMAPCIRATMKQRHMNWAIGCNKERAHALGELPPLPDIGPIDVSKMGRSEYWPIGGRNTKNNNSTMLAGTLGTGCFRGSGGLTSTYRQAVGAPLVPKGFGHSEVGLGPKMQALSRSMSAPSLPPPGRISMIGR